MKKLTLFALAMMAFALKRKRIGTGFAHLHVFMINGRRFVTEGTIANREDPSSHTHFLRLDRGTRMRISFDPFGLGHTHTARIRGKLFRSKGPF